ncbi:glycosyltransferase family 2 protein [Mycolicibacterium rhodesiae]|uniref:Glycosyltransferase 2-like domain-containing protein n=1 Tax=Mycolicibacterium rhodesiae TaxID=36814 RepID=A0A1X0IN87_MYCRH|nr:glycosyltransferase family A protein [Mycolicibacterium rhodesiae]MCV7347662.1 glycosyltransferase family 2 protein [Mycolicibacterium rhodesiae]ORB49232.1 hypothetical protein BST42_23550 [Mycolicibacterium rhodesiae]
MSPRVSVVIPAYNSVAFIDATMRSILGQTFTDFELLVSDHSSTDGTWEALQKYSADPRVRLSRLASGGGGAANWNAVTARAAGEFVKLVCGDDVLYPECLAAQVEALTANSSAALAASRRDVIDAAGGMVLRNRGLAGLKGAVGGGEAIRRTVVAGTNIFGEPASVLFRRAALIDAGGWDGRQAFLLDLAAYCAVLLRGDLVVVPRPLAAFRISDSQWSVRLVRTQAEQFIAFFKKFAAENPGVIGSRDVLVGSTRAHANAFARRAVYIRLDDRMRSQLNSKSVGEGRHPVGT